VKRGDTGFKPDCIKTRNCIKKEGKTLPYLITRITQYCAGGKIEKNEMNGACGAYGGGERCAQGSSWET